MGVVASAVGNLFGGGPSGDPFAVFRSPAGSPGAAVPRAPRIPDVIQPSDPRVQQARSTVLGRSAFLGRTRGGTLDRRRSLLSSARTTSTILGGS